MELQIILITIKKKRCDFFGALLIGPNTEMWMGKQLSFLSKDVWITGELTTKSAHKVMAWIGTEKIVNDEINVSWDLLRPRKPLKLISTQAH